ncbi:hypothetical protein R1flu_028435 [Riccia fluitans]|uniref:Reverse transcriptase zinc-binding domain-containing protein n=1 Tax=Riccia fluitans TaxID=41844 RepID=A0ABD1XLN1_9MARC
MMQIKLLTGPYKQEWKLWTSEMALLLLSSWKFEEASTVDRLLKVWFRFRKFLRFSGEFTVVLANLPIVSLKKWWMLIGEECPDAFAMIEECAKKLGAVKVGDVSKEEWVQEIDVIRTGETWVGNVEAGAFVFRWLLRAQITVRPLQQVAGWVWQPDILVGERWELPNRIWLRMLYARSPSVEGLNRHWRVEQNDVIWRNRWRLLWAGKALMKHRTWIWRLLQLGFPTCERAEKWEKSDGKCPWCRGEKESIAHLALTPAGLTLLSEHCLACWKEQNGLVFEKKRAVASPRLVFLRAKVSVEAGWSRLRGEKRERVHGKDELFMAKAITALQEQEERERSVGRILNSCEEMSRLTEFDLGASVGLQISELSRVLATSGSSSSDGDASEDSVFG